MLHVLESLESRRLLSNTGVISGSVYNDLNANAKHEAGEAGLKSARVYLDANNNGKLDKRETSALTDKRGQFRFEGLAAGTHRLRQDAPTGYRISGPRSSWFKITLAEGQHVARRQFANAPAVVVTSLPTDSVVEYTYYGDSDFTGVVNFDDYARTDDGFNSNRTGWFNGDFDYNGVVNFDDYHLIDLAFNAQGGTVLTAMDFLEGRSPIASPIVQFPTTPTGSTTTTPPPAKMVTAQEQATLDVTLNKKNKTLAKAISWLVGNKNVARSAGVQAAIDGYQKFGIEYKRAFLRIGNS
jgi:hypothetical protein